MTTEGVITTQLDEQELARINVLAQRNGVSRDEMLSMLVRAGMPTCEQEAAALRRGDGDAS